MWRPIDGMRAARCKTIVRRSRFPSAVLARSRRSTPVNSRLARSILLTLGAAALAAAAVVIVRRPPAVATIVVDAAERHQTIDGWAVNLRQWEEDKANNRYDRTSDPHLDRIYRFLADSVGINAVRLEIPSVISAWIWI